MKLILFLGPTLEADAARRLWTASCRLEIRPPAAQGDVYAAAREAPWGIALVDGYFEHVPSVWHKEILWALSQGVRVYGAASMGALRAAELESFGMVGVGRIFEAFRDGVLERDDEVAVAHGPAETGYRRLSEALVDLRFALEAAEADGAVDGSARRLLVQLARDTFYPYRHWEGVLEAAHLQGVDTSSLQDWLGSRYRSTKREDAIQLLAEICQAATDPAAATRPPAGEPVPETSLWLRFRRETEERLAAESAQRELLAGVVDELRLADPAAYGDLRHRALLHRRGPVAPGGPGSPGDKQRLDRHARRFRQERGLMGFEDTERWLESRELDADRLAELLREEARWEPGTPLPRPWLDRFIADRLRLDGRFELYARRHADKVERLTGSPIPSQTPEEQSPEEQTPEEPSLDDLWRWYFEDRLGRPMPHDLKFYAARLDFPTLADLERAVADERRFRDAVSETPFPKPS